jgi:hypothetical protein
MPPPMAKLAGIDSFSGSLIPPIEIFFPPNWVEKSQKIAYISSLTII